MNCNACLARKQGWCHRTIYSGQFVHCITLVQYPVLTQQHLAVQFCFECQPSGIKDMNYCIMLNCRHAIQHWILNNEDNYPHCQFSYDFLVNSKIRYLFIRFSFLVMIFVASISYSYNCYTYISCCFLLVCYLPVHFAWVVDDAKCIVVTRISVSVCLCVCVCVCLRLYAHTAARTQM